MTESQAHEIDLHDSIIQALYAIGLRLEYCMDIVEASPPQVRDILDGVIGHLGEIIAELRVGAHEID